ncbi:hydrogenase 1 maturation protease, partial [Salmonella enterica subsp. enterica]|nr:hydrogenase 1 maturation protease [Salmonella enterica subsp. enterica serovar Javiana]
CLSMENYEGVRIRQYQTRLEGKRNGE